VEAQLLQRLEAVDDPATAAAATDFRPAKFMATASPAAFFFDEVSMMVGQERPPNSSDVVSLFGSQPISKTRLPCCAIM